MLGSFGGGEVTAFHLSFSWTASSEETSHSRSLVAIESLVIAGATTLIHLLCNELVVLVVSSTLLGTILPSLCSHIPAHLVMAAVVLRELQHRDPWTLRKNSDLLILAFEEFFEVSLSVALCCWDLITESFLGSLPETCRLVLCFLEWLFGDAYSFRGFVFGTCCLGKAVDSLCFVSLSCLILSLLTRLDQHRLPDCSFSLFTAMAPALSNVVCSEHA